jgi:hypothetical protein
MPRKELADADNSRRLLSILLNLSTEFITEEEEEEEEDF